MPTEPRHPLVEIKDAVADFVAKESELAAAELKPAAKAGAIGAGFFAGAALFAFHAVWMLVIVVALAIGLLLQGLLFEPQDLVHLGVNSLSMTPVALDDVRASLAEVTFEEAKAKAAAALNGDFYKPAE